MIRRVKNVFNKRLRALGKRDRVIIILDSID
jgi:hypothetical protein